MLKPNHTSPRQRDGKIALADAPRICTVSAFPALCQQLQLFNRTPHRSTIARWVRNGTVPTKRQGNGTFILVHQYLRQLGLAF